jgi:hypothetical protein
MIRCHWNHSLGVAIGLLQYLVWEMFGYEMDTIVALKWRPCLLPVWESEFLEIILFLY